MQNTLGEKDNAKKKKKNPSEQNLNILMALYSDS